jgi:hypothetical protein
MIVFTTLHTANYERLAAITYNNKLYYCKKHKYPLLLKNNNWRNIEIGFEKAFLILDAFNQYPSCEWVFFSECDTFITNMDIKLETIIQNESKHFVITTDSNGINAGSFFVRNSAEGKLFLKTLIDNISSFGNEQHYFQVVHDANYYNLSNLISLYPQRSFNSYEYSTMIKRNIGLRNLDLDCFENNGNWEYGDFMIHWPSFSLEDRILLGEKYSLSIVDTDKEDYINMWKFLGRQLKN